MANAVTLKDKNGVECYPKSHVKQIVDSSGKTQETVNKETSTKLTELGSVAYNNKDLIKRGASLLNFNKQNLILTQGIPTWDTGVIQDNTHWVSTPMIPGWAIDSVATIGDMVMNVYAYNVDGTYIGQKNVEVKSLSKSQIDSSILYIFSIKNASTTDISPGINKYLSIKYTNYYLPQWIENLIICDRSKFPVLDNCNAWINCKGESVAYEKSKYGPSNDKGFLLEENDKNYSILFPCAQGVTYIIDTDMETNRNTALFIPSRPEDSNVPYFFLSNRYNSDITKLNNHPTVITSPGLGYILYLYQREAIAGIDNISINVHKANQKSVGLITTNLGYEKSKIGFNPNDYSEDLRNNVYERDNYSSIIIPITKPCNIHIKKSAVTDRDRACTTQDYPVHGAPIKAVLMDISDSTKTDVYFTINLTPCYLVYLFSNTSQEVNITVDCNPLLGVTIPKNRGININWDKWSDVRYNYGFDKTKQPMFNTIEGVVETDTMFSCRGGKGRWNTNDNPSSLLTYGGHVFEGWNKNETFRLTMLIGKYEPSLACIQTYSPAGLSESNRRFGWVKIGSDDTGAGFDFGRKWGVAYGPLSLYQSSEEINSVYDADLHPAFKNNSATPNGTIYYDTKSQHIKCKTSSGWRTLKFTDE